jgi:NitT/TauT family transport system ATP-binding protein
MTAALLVHAAPAIAADPPMVRPRSAPARLRVKDVSKRFVTKRGEVHALDNVSLDIAPGEFVCLIGPSGCGKSTLLDIMAGLTQPDAGAVLSDNEAVSGPARDRLVMFQEPALFPWLDAFGNVMFGLKLKPGLTNEQRREIARDHLEMVGLGSFMHTYVHELSGGMKQRVALARALAPQPKMLLMDEPFASVDAQTRAELEDLTLKVHRDHGMTTLFITHDIDESVYLANRVIVLRRSPGRLMSVLDVDLPFPRDQIATREHDAFVRLRGEVARLIRAAARNVDVMRP